MISYHKLGTTTYDKFCDIVSCELFPQILLLSEFLKLVKLFELLKFFTFDFFILYLTFANLSQVKTEKEKEKKKRKNKQRTKDKQKKRKKNREKEKKKKGRTEKKENKENNKKYRKKENIYKLFFFFQKILRKLNLENSPETMITYDKLSSVMGCFSQILLFELF